MKCLMILFRFLIAACLLLSPLAAEDGFVPLFNGKDLSGWEVVNTAPSTWSFNDEGYLVCSGKPIGEIRTERMYQNFILEAEWRHLVPKGNAGIFVWADDITARGQPFIRGVEVQVLENAYGDTRSHTTHGDIFPIHGATMTPENGRGGSRAFPTENRSNPSPEWNHYRIECRDGAISLAVNGKVVTRGRDCIPRKGYICLESEGGVVHWRNVRIKELPATPIDPAHVAIEDRGFRCLYNGVDFTGWKVVDGWKSSDWELVNDAGAVPIITEERFSGDGTFILDWKRRKDSGVPALLIHGRRIELDPGHPAFGKTDTYSRIEVAVSEGVAMLKVNDQSAGEFRDIPAAGPFGFVSEGASIWANPYFRSER